MNYAPLSAEGRVIMVSGANRGIGRAVAEWLYNDGYSLSLGARRKETLAPVVSSMNSDRILLQEYDARTPGAASAWVQETAARFGQIDGVVNNAGVSIYNSINDHDDGPLEEMWNVNTRGPFQLIKAAFPFLKLCAAGRIVNIVSLSGKRVADDALTSYAMTKFATMALTNAVRRSGWEFNVRCTAICPGFVDTDMTAGVQGIARSKMIPPGAIAQIVGMILSLPNAVSIAEIPVNCRLEDTL